MESLFPQACGLSVSHRLFPRGGKPPHNGFGKVFFFYPLLALIGWRWWAMRDSNPRPAVCKTAALTAAPIALFPTALTNCKSGIRKPPLSIRNPKIPTRAKEVCAERRCVAKESPPKFAGYCPSSSSRMTRAVQPVWWLAPSPRALSPSKYS